MAGGDIFDAGGDNAVGSDNGGDPTSRDWLDFPAVATAVTRHHLG
ncbi:hypothetical protein [Kitasatospora arboriphila]|uniref:Uncharacterized protein n=1 Tax=Kitasatospora arboriphila TaxID=258052 RepID=A0ABN1U3Y7_9ACTN